MSEEERLVRSDDTHYGRLFWVCLVIGASIMIFGVAGALRHASETLPVSFAAWIVGLALLHDLLLVPVVCALGLLVSKRLHGRWRVWFQSCLLISGVIALFSVPFIAGFGRLPDNPSLLPGNYVAGLALTLSFVWVVGALMVVASSRMRRAGTGGER